MLPSRRVTSAKRRGKDLSEMERRKGEKFRRDGDGVIRAPQEEYLGRIENGSTSSSSRGETNFELFSSSLTGVSQRLFFIVRQRPGFSSENSTSNESPREADDEEEEEEEEEKEKGPVKKDRGPESHLGSISVRDQGVYEKRMESEKNFDWTSEERLEYETLTSEKGPGRVDESYAVGP
ncbi:hypothetical protein HZH68_004841 [Vespula germanica]|uniref:Uncharacterized protein n=1 Tax=Vespula germanica TaxID=30212 RepID=A0A834NHL1_VESGE|nr:hypothetical protein HZH68_004841 [Vespula germanica]